MAGWPINDASNYAKAAAKAKEVIDNQAAYGFGLMPNFIDLWESATVKASGNKEEVFALNFLGAGTGTSQMHGLELLQYLVKQADGMIILPN